MVDTRVMFHHMRYGGTLQVGIKQPYMLWIHDGKKEKLKVKTKKPLKTIWDHPLYQQHDPLQRPDIFIKAGLPPERPPEKPKKK